MYAYISGTLEEVREEYIVVDNHGIGYRILVPLRLHDELPQVGSAVKIYTHLHVREDAFVLYGFSSPDEIEMFRMLTGVSGIGPKGALALLSVYSANDIRFAVVSEDDARLAKAPGIGKKTAQRLIIELKDRINLEDAVAPLSGAEPIPYDGELPVKRDAMEALVALGYSASDAARALAGIEATAEDDVEDILKQALRNLATI